MLTCLFFMQLQILGLGFYSYKKRKDIKMIINHKSRKKDTNNIKKTTIRLSPQNFTQKIRVELSNMYLSRKKNYSIQLSVFNVYRDKFIK